MKFVEHRIFQIPSALKELLVDDADLINRQMKLVRLPARYTVDDIINQVCNFWKMNSWGAMHLLSYDMSTFSRLLIADAGIGEGKFVFCVT